MLICGAVNFIASLPFWFLPYSLPKEGENENLKISHLPVQGDHCKIDPPAQPQLKFSEAVKGERLLPKCLHVNFLSRVHSELSMDLHMLSKMHVSAVQMMGKNALFNMLRVCFSPLMSDSWKNAMLLLLAPDILSSTR